MKSAGLSTVKVLELILNILAYIVYFIHTAVISCHQMLALPLSNVIFSKSQN